MIPKNVSELYGAHSNPAYPTALLDLADRLGYRVIGSGWHYGTCTARLSNPCHRCSHDRIESSRNCIDHAVWMVRGDGRRPEQWALLSQPYGIDAAAFDLLATERGATWRHLGPAPYGHGTAAVLIEGRVSDRERGSRRGA